jgi:hypothetical protein
MQLKKTLCLISTYPKFLMQQKFYEFQTLASLARRTTLWAVKNSVKGNDLETGN